MHRFGRQKPKDPNKDKSKPLQKNKQDKRQPAALKVDFPETKYTSGNDDPSTWGTFATDKEGDKDSKRRSSRTSGASVGHGETQFGPDVLFEQDQVPPHPEITPPPHERKKVTIKSMRHKVAKTYGLSKSSSKGITSHEGGTEPQTPLSPSADSRVTDDTTSVDEQSLESGGGERENEQVVKHSLSPNRVPSLELFDDFLGDKEQDGQVSRSQQSHQSVFSEPTEFDPLLNTQDEDEETFTAPRQGSNEEKQKQKERLQKAKAAQSSKTSLHDVLFKQKGNIRKLTNDLTAKEAEVKQLQQELSAEKAAKSELQTKLDARDIAHGEHLKTKLAEVNTTFEQQLQVKESSLQKALCQIETLKKAESDALTRTKEQYEKDLNEAKAQHERDLAVQQVASKKYMDLCVIRETEIQKLKNEQETLKLGHTSTVEGLQQQLADAQSQLELAKKNHEKELEQSQTNFKMVVEEKQQLIEDHEKAIKEQERLSEDVQFHLEEQQLQLKSDELEKLQTETEAELRHHRENDEEEFFDTVAHEVPDDNLTDAEKVSELTKESEGLRDEIEQLTAQLTVKEQELEAANAHLKEVSDFHGNHKVLAKQLQELQAANAELEEAVRVAAAEIPASPVGVQQGDEASKMVNQIKAKYLEQLTKTMDERTKYENLVQQHQREKRELQTRYERKKKELTDKISEKDRENRELRKSNPLQARSELSRSFSYEEPPEDVDPKLHIVELKQALKSSEEKIEEFKVQIRSFQEVASQRQQLESHSEVQSAIVLQLRRDLEKANKDFKQLEKAKDEVEDERDVLKNELSHERDNNKSLKKQLAESQTVVTSLRPKSAVCETAVDVDEQEVILLRTEANLFKIELEEHGRNAARSGKSLAELGRQKLSLERKLADVNKERDNLSRQVLELQATKREMKERLDKLDRLKTDVEAAKEHMAVLRDTVVAKTEEIDGLNEKIKNLNEELEASKFQARSELSRSFSYEEPPEDVDPRLHIVELKQALKSSEEKIEVFKVQIRSFQEVASQRQQLESHSKVQSAIVLQLRRDLEKANKDFKQLEQAKDEVEDERDVLKNELSHERDNNKSLKKQLAESQTVVTSLRPKSAVYETAVDVEEQEVTLLRTEANLFKIELEEHRRNASRSEKSLADLRRQNLSLEQKLAGVKKERDNLSRQVLELQATKREMKKNLDNLYRFKTKAKEHMAVLRDTVVAKTEHCQVDGLNEQIKNLKEELEASKFQVQQYIEDFKEERQARANAVGAKDSDFGRFTLEIQELNDELARAKQSAETERAEKQAVIATLESTVIELQQTQRQLNQADKDYALKVKSDELAKLANEKRELIGQMEHFRNLSQKYKKQLETEELVYQQRQAEFEQNIDRLKGEAEQCKAVLAEKTQLVAVEKLSLEEQLEKVNAEYNLKEKQLEIMATEKAVLEQELGHEKANSTALTLELEESKKKLEEMAANKANIDNELSRMRASSAALALEVQEGRQQLEVTIADTARLSDEVLAKTQQVKQYKKQNDSYKFRLDETAAELNQTTARLNQTTSKLEEAQKDFQEQIKRMEGDHQTKRTVSTRVQELERHLSERDACIRGLQQNVFRNREDNRKLMASNQQLWLTLSRGERVQQSLNFKLKQFQAQHQPRQQVPPHFDERTLHQHTVHVRHSMTFDTHIGEGSYGAVYAVMYDGKHCIAKRLHDILIGRKRAFPVSDREKDGIHGKFVQECILLSQQHHPNIVKFIGVIFGREKYDLTLLMERLSTDLEVYLLNNPNVPLSLKVSILCDVSCGLLFLHGQFIIHRDLSAANILLTADTPIQAKIADLGMSRYVDGEVRALTNAPGAQAYMSPEALQEKKYDESLDVFSFGVIALFAAIQEFPKFSHVHVPEDIHVKGEGEIYKRQTWITKMNNQQPELSSLVLWCLQDDPMKRPTTFTLNTLLNEMKKDYPM